MSDTTQALIEFPCDFPVKALALSREDLDLQVYSIVRRHASSLSEAAVTTRLSANGKYTSVTVTVRAESRAQLDDIYRDLTACSDIVMVL